MMDVRAYEFSKIWLATGGWTYEMDARRLAELVQSVCEEFVMELEEKP